MGFFGLSKEEKLIKDTAGQIEAIVHVFNMSLATASELRGRQSPVFGDKFLMVTFGTAIGIGKVMGKDPAFMTLCLKKYLSKYKDADAVLDRIHGLVSSYAHLDIFNASIEAYQRFHNSGDQVSSYLRLANAYLDSFER